jgi:hypothetical protein
MSYDPSPAAVRILRNTFETAANPLRPAWPDPEQMAVAVDAGIMFPEPRALDHDGWVNAARQAGASVNADEISEAFLASLTTRRLDLRSALSSYAVARVLPEHPYTPWYNTGCAVCGLFVRKDGTIKPKDLNVFSWYRFGSGGYSQNDIDYIAFDLEQFPHAPRPALTAADVSLGQQIIEYLRQLPPATTAAQAVKGMTMLRGNNAERGELLDILRICGILHDDEHPGYSDTFIPYTESIKFPGVRYPFGHYPTWWWRASGGISTSALRRFLPQLR